MDLLRGLAHELRAPLQSLLGHVDLLRDGTFGTVSDEQAEALAAVGRSAERILAIADDVLQVARIDAGQEAPASETVDLTALLREEAMHIVPAALAKGLDCHVVVPDGLVVTSDAAKLRRIATNLLRNAVKYTDEGTVTMRAGPGYFEVADTGIGIPADRAEAVFEEYVRLHPDRTGTGLGLAIVRRLARLLGARVLLDSVPGKGATFRVELPRGADRG